MRHVQEQLNQPERRGDGPQPVEAGPPRTRRGVIEGGGAWSEGAGGVLGRLGVRARSLTLGFVGAGSGGAKNQLPRGGEAGKECSRVLPGWGAV